MDTKQAEVGLLAFKENWDKKYPEISRKWQENWTELTHFMDYCSEIRRMIYTTNAVEALHRQMRKVTKTKGAWMNEKGLLKLLYLALIYKGNGWNKKVPSWIKIQRELMVTFGKRYTDWIVN
jgi:transposase-like protein